MAHSYGRFARNAVVQGAAAELFKAWAATVRAGLLGLDARIVLCLHDELLVETTQRPRGAGGGGRRVGAAVDRVVVVRRQRRAPRADTSVVRSWAEAK